MTVASERHQMVPSLNFWSVSFGPANIQQHKPGKTILCLKKWKSKGKKINQNLTSLWLLSSMSSKDSKGYFRPGFDLMEQQGSSFLLDPWYNHIWWNHCGHICWNLPSFQICFKRLNPSVFKGHHFFSSPPWCLERRLGISQGSQPPLAQDAAVSSCLHVPAWGDSLLGLFKFTLGNLKENVCTCL